MTEQEQLDPMASLMTALSRRNGPWIYHENSETGACAIFPKTEKDAEAWEARAVLMHSRQETLTLEDKPAENEYTRKLSRGD